MMKNTFKLSIQKTRTILWLQLERDLVPASLTKRDICWLQHDKDLLRLLYPKEVLSKLVTNLKG